MFEIGKMYYVTIVDDDEVHTTYSAGPVLEVDLPLVKFQRVGGGKAEEIINTSSKVFVKAWLS